MAYDGVNGNTSTITFGTSGISMEILNFTPPGVNVEEIDMTHLGSTWQERNAGAVKMTGELTITAIYDPDKTNTTDGNINDAIGVEETITITFPNPGSTAATIAFSGFVKSYEPGEVSNDTRAEITLVIAVDGALTITAST